MGTVRSRRFPEEELVGIAWREGVEELGSSKMLSFVLLLYGDFGPSEIA